MRYHEIKETQTGMHYDKGLKKVVDHNKQDFLNSPHVADIEDYHVRKTDKNTYSLWDQHNDNFVGFFHTIPQDDPDAIELQMAFIEKEYRGKKLFSMFLWFLKTREKYSSIILGEQHSVTTAEILTTLSRFKKFWFKGDEKIPYDPETTDDYYSVLEPTGWKIVLESEKSKYNYEWPRYNQWRTNSVSDNYLAECYEPYID